MILNLYNNNITLELENDNLKKYQSSQLDFFGYIQKENVYHLASKNLESDVQKIVEYLSQELVNYELAPSIQELLEDINNNKKQRTLVINSAKDIKNGIIDKNAFNKFNYFLESLPRKLKPHQKKAAYHLYTLKNGANFSVPGSGKTSVVISVYEKLKLEGKCNLIFVVGPPSCFQPWKSEFKETLGRNIESITLSGGKKVLRKEEYYKSGNEVAELYLSTFQTIMNDYQEVINLLSQKNVNCYFVVDEAHYMKQIGGSWSNSLLQIANHTKFRCILTGTPIPKSYTDVFNLFDFLWFDIPPLDQEDKIKIRLFEKKKNNIAVKELLNEKVGALFYRVRKQDLGLKPAIFHNPIVLTMNFHENRIYEMIKSKLHELSEDDFLNNEEILSKLWKGRMIRLRQSISYPKLLLKSLDNYNEDLLENNSDLIEMIKNYDILELTGKLEYLTNMVRELNEKNQKVLIWSNFVGTLELIKSHFTKQNLNCELIYGKTPVKKSNPTELSEEMTRDEIRDVFVDPNSGLDILIANPAACAESISLHKTCFHAIYYDLSYNCAQYLQSLDRIHRVGGSEINSANYYFLQYENSIDQDIKLNLETKAQKMYDIVEQDYEIYNLDMIEETEEDDIAAYKRLFH